ncbi:MAG: YihY/virulence factor BrkB family protein [Amaricoccus sp.]
MPPRAWGAVFRRVWNGITEHHLSIIAAGVAFFAVLAMFPAIAALIAVYGLVADPHQVYATLASVKPLLPVDVFDLLATQVNAVVAAPQAKLGIASLVSFALLLWSARAGVTALIEGLNVVYREIDERSLLAQYLISLALTFVLIVGVVVALLAVVAVPAILAFTDVGAVGDFLARWVPLLILGVAVVFVIGALYRYGPHRAFARKRWITVGAVVATLGWLAVSLALSAYFSSFPNFNRTYGSLGAIAGLLFWLYASAFVVLLGAELNAALELQTAHDTTTGRPRPMGERGAYVADHVA